MLKSCAALLLFAISASAVADGSPHALTMWSVEGAHNRIYLLGSIHMLRPQDYPLHAAIDAAYEDSDSIIMELDMDDIDPMAMQGLITRMGVLTDGDSLRTIMGDTLYAEADATASELEIPFAMLNQTEPWLAAITIEQMILARLGFNPLYGIEMYVSGKSSEDQKSIDGLETVEEQLGMLDGLSLNAQNTLLMQTLADGATAASLMDDMVAAWHRGDTQYLEEQLLADVEKYPELHQSIVVDRNRNWVREIDKLLDDHNNYLVVVGALHLVGDDGVPAILARKGYEVTQLSRSGN